MGNGITNKEEFLENPDKHSKISVRDFFVELYVLLDHTLQLLVQMVAIWSYSSVSWAEEVRRETTGALK